MASALQNFFENILSGESQTYNDYNYYNTSGLNSFIEGSSKFSKKYPPLQKPLSEYTIGEIQDFQSRPRDSTGKLWATGKYQIIPSTFNGLVTTLGLSKTTKYNKETQDKMGYQLLMDKPAIKDYILGNVADTKDNLEKASLGVAQVWSSVGVPYAVKGHWQNVLKNQSFYHPKDRGSHSTESVQEALKTLRLNKENVFKDTKIRGSKNNITKTIFFVALLTIAGYVLLTQTKEGKNLLAKLK